MANEQSKRQGQQGGQPQATREQSGTMARTGDGGEQGMATTRQYQDPLSLLDGLFERMQRDFFGTSLLNALIPSQGGAGNGGGAAVRVPRVQMRDAGDALELTAELPGIEGPNVSVQIEDDVLTISGEASTEEERDDTRMERYVSFYRQIPLPDGLDTEHAEAAYRNGMLTIRFPKAAERSNARQIPVNTEQSGTEKSEAQRTQDKAA